MEYVGKRACVVIDFGDESDLVFFGNPTGCKIRYPLLNESSVLELDTDRKVIETKHLYRYKIEEKVELYFIYDFFFEFFFRSRGVYNVHAFAFDIRHYTEISVPVTIFRIPCTNPQVFLPKNQTSFDKIDLIPSYKISDSFKNQAVVFIQCNETMATSTEWKIYQV